VDHESPEFQAAAEAAYCQKLMERLVEYELNPRNFTKAMRAQNALTRRFNSYDYNNNTNIGSHD
jgi:hypothetical protein